MKPIQSASEIEGLEVYELTLRQPRSYNEDEKDAAFIGEVTLHSTTVSGLSEFKVKLDGELSKNLIRALAPILAQSASNAAKKLAEDATALSNALSGVMLKQIESKPEQPEAV